MKLQELNKSSEQCGRRTVMTHVSGTASNKRRRRRWRRLREQIKMIQIVHRACCMGNSSSRNSGILRRTGRKRLYLCWSSCLWYDVVRNKTRFEICNACTSFIATRHFGGSNNNWYEELKLFNWVQLNIVKVGCSRDGWRNDDYMKRDAIVLSNHIYDHIYSTVCAQFWIFLNGSAIFN